MLPQRSLRSLPPSRSEAFSTWWPPVCRRAVPCCSLRPPARAARAEIAWHDNIPVLSYFLLRGRCRNCSARISPVYPAVEAATAVLAVACVAVFGLTAYAALAVGFCALLVTLSAIDVRHRIVPDRLVLPAAALVLLVHNAIDPSAEWLLAALAAAGLLFLAALAHPKGLGLGDVKLALVLGAMLGATVSIALFLGFVVALVPAAVLFARYGSAARKMAVPLVPFLSVGAVVALFFGERLLDSYLGLF